jgi:hypothetical protein
MKLSQNYSLCLVACLAFALSASPALAATCGMDFQHAYEKGVKDGRSDGSHLKKPDPTSHGRKVSLKNDDRGKCYREGYSIGYQNAAADAKKATKQPRYDNAPTPGSNERAYYDDGCHEGTSDAQMSMSMAYARHADMYDRRFEPFFRDGYEHCWKMFR